MFTRYEKKRCQFKLTRGGYESILGIRMKMPINIWKEKRRNCNNIKLENRKPSENTGYRRKTFGKITLIC